MRVIVTGASGFIGSQTVRALVTSGHQVATLGRSPATIESKLLSKVTHFEGRFQDAPWKEIEKFAADACIHTAWITTPGVYLNSELNAQLAEYSAVFLQPLAQIGVGKLIVLGTSIEYELSSPTPFQEDLTPIHPIHPYSEAKVRLHKKLINELSTKTSLTWARVFYPYGPGEDKKRLCSSLIQQAFNGENLNLKNPFNIVDCIHVRDAASALVSILEHFPGGDINIGSGQGVSTLELTKTICDLMDCHHLLQLPTTSPQQEPVSIIADTTKLRSIGWTAKNTLKTGLRELISSLDPSES